jgi:excisionase family DNA binding protein
MMSGIFTAQEAAVLLRVRPVTIRRLFNSGALPGVILKQGARRRIVRFREEAIEAFLTEREQRAPRAEVGNAVQASGT